MAFKFIVFAAFLAYAKAGNIIGSAPLAYAAAPAIATPLAAVARAEPYDPHPQYQYGYEINDAITGDSKSQFEQRDGDVVHGSYSLTDSDGSRRTVDYTADPVNGFNAVVRKEPLVAKAVVAHAAPVIQAAPVLRSYAAPAPIVHSAPLLRAAPAYFH